MLDTTNIIDYTACAVHSRHRFPPIGDAAYHQHAGGGPSHRHTQHAHKLIKIASVVSEISSRQTDIITILVNEH